MYGADHEPAKQGSSHRKTIVDEGYAMDRRVVQILFVAGIQDEQPRNGSADESGNKNVQARNLSMTPKKMTAEAPNEVTMTGAWQMSRKAESVVVVASMSRTPEAPIQAKIHPS